MSRTRLSRNCSINIQQVGPTVDLKEILTSDNTDWKNVSLIPLELLNPTTLSKQKSAYRNINDPLLDEIEKNKTILPTNYCNYIFWDLDGKKCKKNITPISYYLGHNTNRRIDEVSASLLLQHPDLLLMPVCGNNLYYHLVQTGNSNLIKKLQGFGVPITFETIVDSINATSLPEFDFTKYPVNHYDCDLTIERQILGPFEFEETQSYFEEATFIKGFKQLIDCSTNLDFISQSHENLIYLLNKLLEFKKIGMEASTIILNEMAIAILQHINRGQIKAAEHLQNTIKGLTENQLNKQTAQVSELLKKHILDKVYPFFDKNETKMDNNDSKQLEEAVQKHNKLAVQIALMKKDVCEHEQKSLTAIHEAIKQEHLGIINLLIKQIQYDPDQILKLAMDNKNYQNKEYRFSVINKLLQHYKFPLTTLGWIFIASLEEKDKELGAVILRYLNSIAPEILTIYIKQNSKSLDDKKSWQQDYRSFLEINLFNNNSSSVNQFHWKFLLRSGYLNAIQSRIYSYEDIEDFAQVKEYKDLEIFKNISLGSIQEFAKTKHDDLFHLAHLYYQKATQCHIEQNLETATTHYNYAARTLIHCNNVFGNTPQFYNMYLASRFYYIEAKLCQANNTPKMDILYCFISSLCDLYEAAHLSNSNNINKEMMYFKNEITDFIKTVRISEEDDLDLRILAGRIRELLEEYKQQPSKVPYVSYLMTIVIDKIILKFNKPTHEDLTHLNKSHLEMSKKRNSLLSTINTQAWSTFLDRKILELQKLDLKNTMLQITESELHCQIGIAYFNKRSIDQAIKHLKNAINIFLKDKPEYNSRNLGEQHLIEKYRSELAAILFYKFYNWTGENKALRLKYFTESYDLILKNEKECTKGLNLVDRKTLSALLIAHCIYFPELFNYCTLKIGLEITFAHLTQNQQAIVKTLLDSTRGYCLLIENTYKNKKIDDVLQLLNYLQSVFDAYLKENFSHGAYPDGYLRVFAKIAFGKGYCMQRLEGLSKLHEAASCYAKVKLYVNKMKQPLIDDKLLLESSEIAFKLILNTSKHNKQLQQTAEEKINDIEIKTNIMEKKTDETNSNTNSTIRSTKIKTKLHLRNSNTKIAPEILSHEVQIMRLEARWNSLIDKNSIVIANKSMCNQLKAERELLGQNISVSAFEELFQKAEHKLAALRQIDEDKLIPKQKTSFSEYPELKKVSRADKAEIIRLKIEARKQHKKIAEAKQRFANKEDQAQKHERARVRRDQKLQEKYENKINSQKKPTNIIFSKDKVNQAKSPKSNHLSDKIGLKWFSQAFMHFLAIYQNQNDNLTNNMAYYAILYHFSRFAVTLRSALHHLDDAKSELKLTEIDIFRQIILHRGMLTLDRQIILNSIPAFLSLIKTEFPRLRKLHLNESPLSYNQFNKLTELKTQTNLIQAVKLSELQLYKELVESSRAESTLSEEIVHSILFNELLPLLQEGYDILKHSPNHRNASNAMAALFVICGELWDAYTTKRVKRYGSILDDQHLKNCYTLLNLCKEFRNKAAHEMRVDASIYILKCKDLVQKMSEKQFIVSHELKSETKTTSRFSGQSMTKK